LSDAKDSRASRPADLDVLVAATPATAFTLVWALELALARVTGQIQAWSDVVVSAALLVVVPTLVVAAIPRLTVPPAIRVSLTGLVTALPLACVTAGIVLPVAARYAGSGTTLLLALLVAGLIVTNVLRARSGEGPAPSTGLTLGLVVGAAATAWVLLPAGFPPFQVHLPFLVVAVLLARLAMRANGLPLVALGGIAFAMWPALMPPPPWQGPGTPNGRPDVVLLSTEGVAPADVAAMTTFARLVDKGQRYDVQPAATAAALLAQILAVDVAGDALAAETLPATLAARLAAEGYDAAAVVAAVPDLDVDKGFHRGFAAFHHFIDRNRYALPRWRANLGEETVRDYAARPVAADLLTWLGITAPPSFAGARDVLAVAAQIMSERRAAPVFLWVHFADSAQAIDTNSGHILDGLAGDADRPRRIALLATANQAGASGTLPMALGQFGIPAAPGSAQPLDAAAVTRLLLGP
jgi:hypothetical protein